MDWFNLLIRPTAICLLLLSAMTASDRQAKRAEKKDAKKSKGKK